MLEITIIYAINVDGNRITIIIVGGLCYPFDGYLYDYEIELRLDDILNFNIDNEEELLSEEDFRDLTGIQVKEEFTIVTKIKVH